MVCVYSFATISGGYFNPASVISIWFSGRGGITMKQLLFYVPAQMAGGVAGGMFHCGLSELFENHEMN